MQLKCSLAYLWEMHPEVAEVLEILGWVAKAVASKQHRMIEILDAICILAYH